MMRWRLLGASLVLLLSVAVLSAATLSIDTFSGTTGIELTTHAGELGASWSKNTSSTGDLYISSTNTARLNNALEFVDYYASGTPPTADYSARVDFVVKTAPVASQYYWLTVRGSTTENTNDQVIYDGDSGSWFLESVITGGGMVLDTYAVAVTPGTYTVILTGSGTSLSATINGTPRLAGTDATITASGMVGVGGYSTVTDYENQGIQFDNLQVTDASTTHRSGLTTKGVSLLLPWGRF